MLSTVRLEHAYIDWLNHMIDAEDRVDVRPPTGQREWPSTDKQGMTRTQKRPEGKIVQSAR